MGLHPRGNFEGFLRAGSKQKWLEVHGDTHFTLFYAKYGQDLQRQFFDRFLKGIDNGWEQAAEGAAATSAIPARNSSRAPRTNGRWRGRNGPSSTCTPDRELDPAPPEDAATSTYATLERRRDVLDRADDRGRLEITGPVAAKLFVSSDTTDADLFLVLRVFDPHGKEVTFIGSNDPRVPVGLGWLRASHRKLDPKESKPYRPYHTHDEEWPLKPGEPVELDIEIWPTSIVVPKGYRLALSVRGKDYEVDGTDAALPHAPYPMKGVGPFTHTNPLDRPPHIFGGRNTLHFGGKFAAVCAAADHSEMTVRAAIIGLGRWGRSLVNAVHGKTDAIRFTAAYTRTRASAEQYCREKNIPMLDRFEDALATPTSTPWCWRRRTAATPSR